MKAENFENEDCLQKDSTECERYVGALNTDNRETEEMDGATLLEEILSRKILTKHSRG